MTVAPRMAKKALAEERFWAMAEVLLTFMRRHGVQPFDHDDARKFRVAISDEFWQLARDHVASLGRERPPIKPIPYYHRLFGFSAIVDPKLRGDEIRLERLPND